MSRQTVTRSFQRISFHYNQLTDNLNRLTCNIYLWEDRQLYVNIIRFCLLICLGWNLSALIFLKNAFDFQSVAEVIVYRAILRWL